MPSLIFLMLISLLQPSFAKKSTVPVLMLDYDLVMSHVQIEPNPFVKYSSADFTDILYDCKSRGGGVIIFVENNFSAEDISTKDTNGTPYKQIEGNLLANKDKVKYFPSVEEPFKLLRQTLKPEKGNVLDVSRDTRIQLHENFKHLYIFFKKNLEDTIRETRVQVLRRHDSVIAEVLAAAHKLKSGPIVAFYTGKVNPIVLNKGEFIRDKTIKSSRRTGVFISSPKARFQLFGVHAVTLTRRALLEQLPVVVEEMETKRTLFTRISYDNFDLQFAFSYPEQEKMDWKLDFVAIYEGDEEVGRTVMNVGAPTGYSYYCTEPISIVNNRDMSTITINEYQLEPTREVKTVDKFGPSIHCAPYFSSSLLASLMVTVMCMGILSYGILVLFDCATNNRFEDPNSKPLTHELMH